MDSSRISREPKFFLMSFSERKGKKRGTVEFEMAGRWGGARLSFSVLLLVATGGLGSNLKKARAR